VDQRGGVQQRHVGRAAQAAARQALQIGVEQSHDLIGSLTVSVSGTAKQQRDVLGHP
jgi:hypothetical protein